MKQNLNKNIYLNVNSAPIIRAGGNKCLTNKVFPSSKRVYFRVYNNVHMLEEQK